MTEELFGLAAIAKEKGWSTQRIDVEVRRGTLQLPDPDFILKGSGRQLWRRATLEKASVLPKGKTR